MQNINATLLGADVSYLWFTTFPLFPVHFSFYSFLIEPPARDLQFPRQHDLFRLIYFSFLDFIFLLPLHHARPMYVLREL